MKLETRIDFTHSVIEIPALIFPTREIGASIEFLGIVRELENGSALQGLQYEAHEPMARKHLLSHIDELNILHSCAAVHFIHRLGWVPVNDTSLFVRVQSAHRREALNFLGEFIDRLKKDVPIWKSVS